MMIWRLALPSPRILELEYHHANYEHEGPVMLGYCTPDNPLLGLLLACQESRRETLREYVLSFPTLTMGQRIYFDPSIDTVVIARYTDFESVVPSPLFLGGDIFDKVENICFIAEELETALRFLDNRELLVGYSSVKTIVIGREIEGPLGQPQLEELELEDCDQGLCSFKIRQFSDEFVLRFPNRKVPSVKVMAVHRTIDDVLA